MTEPMAELRRELNALVRLTNVESTRLRSRLPQAATDAVRHQIETRATRSERQAERLASSVTDVEGMPDRIGVQAGRLGAVLKATTGQGQTVEETLLGDLALEHQLHDRAMFARVLAGAAGEGAVVRLLERVEADHADNAEWISTRLAALAAGGQPDLRPTPTQAVVGFTQRAADLPRRQVATGVNKSVSTLGDLRDQLKSRIDTNADRMRELWSAAREIWTAGRDASLDKAEKVARRDGDRRTAKTVHRVRAELGALATEELPIKRYDSLGVRAAAEQIERLREVEDVKAVLAYEEANKDRKGVTTVARERLTELGAELAAVS